MMNNTDIYYEQGKNCYLNNGDISDNPYEGELAEAWLRGYLEEYDVIKELGDVFSGKSEKLEEQSINDLTNKLETVTNRLKDFEIFITSLQKHPFKMARSYKFVIDKFVNGMGLE